MSNKQRITLGLAQQALANPGTEIGQEERRVLEHIEACHPISTDAGELATGSFSMGDRIADSVARIGGSWSFIGAFFLFLLGWAILNTDILTQNKAFDPYPFVFLNLILSMLAAVQAPVIMMSQNRQAEKDRIAAAHDYEVNLRSEFEILAMQQKLDHLRGEQHGLLLAQQHDMLDLLQKMAASRA